MVFELPKLPYEMNALEPYISKETLEYHYAKHHKAYVDNLNKLIVGTEFADFDLEEIIEHSHNVNAAIFNNAAQVWNHTFYWHCLRKNGGGEPSGELLAMLKRTFGSFAEFKEQFTQKSVSLFGSGWAWLVKNDDGGLEIMQTSNAQTPRTQGVKPLLTCDVWEHAYYIDYRNARPKYLEAFWNLVNWEFVAGLLKHS